MCSFVSNYSFERCQVNKQAFLNLNGPRRVLDSKAEELGPLANDLSRSQCLDKFIYCAHFSRGGMTANKSYQKEHCVRLTFLCTGYQFKSEYETLIYVGLTAGPILIILFIYMLYKFYMIHIIEYQSYGTAAWQEARKK